MPLELTNACNMSRVMCGRNAADFKPAFFDMGIFRSLEPLMVTVEEAMGWGELAVHPRFEEKLQAISRHGARACFCANRMSLDALKDAIFDCNVEVFAVSVDGASPVAKSKRARTSRLTGKNRPTFAIIAKALYL